MSYPVLAFHGTKENNIHSICNTGFKVPGEENFEHATDTGKIISVLQQKKNILNPVPKQTLLNTVPCVHYGHRTINKSTLITYGKIESFSSLWGHV